MTTGRKILPPLEYLVAFEATGKSGSFSAASRVLNISESAVSRKVKLLEQHYGVKLFKRDHRSIAITPEGEELLRSVSEALSIFQRASMDLLAKAEPNSLTLSATNSVASLWLMPRLNAFHAANPDINIAIFSSDDDNQCLAETNDLIILRGSGEWSGYDAELLFGETVFPVCSPRFLEENPGAAKPGEIADTGLIDVAGGHAEWMNWSTWFAETGFERNEYHRRTTVNTYPLAIQAALDGLGVVLGWRHLVDQYLDDGRLICPLGSLDVQTEDGYYLLISKQSTESEQREIVRKWLLDISAGEKDTSTDQ
jgi:DNA-binding transcriptional LysR family regulator